MKRLKRLIISIIIVAVTFGFITLCAYGASVFNSNQVGTNPVSGYYLQTNGATSTWEPISAAASSTIIYPGQGILVNASGTNGYVIINNGVTTTLGNWIGTWQGANSTTFYLASNPAGYITSTPPQTVYIASTTPWTIGGIVIASTTGSVTTIASTTYYLSTNPSNYISTASTTGVISGNGVGIPITCATCLSTSTAATTYLKLDGSNENTTLNIGSNSFSAASGTFSGKVMIGSTTAPVDALDVNGGIGFTATSSAPSTGFWVPAALQFEQQIAGNSTNPTSTVQFINGGAGVGVEMILSQADGQQFCLGTCGQFDIQKSGGGVTYSSNVPVIFNTLSNGGVSPAFTLNTFSPSAVNQPAANITIAPGSASGSGASSTGGNIILTPGTSASSSAGLVEVNGGAYVTGNLAVGTTTTSTAQLNVVGATASTTASFANTGTATTTVSEGNASSGACQVMYSAGSASSFQIVAGISYYYNTSNCQ